MTQFAVLHIGKNKGGQVGLSKHISRETIPLNADPERLHLNQTPIGTKNQMEDIKKRIRDGVKQKTAIRKDAVKALQIILTGSHEQMMVIDKGGQLNSWMDKNISWLNETFGKDNVVNVTLHMDELTPHIHATVVPVTNDGRLCAKNFMNRADLKNYQTSYGKAMESFGLSRGVEGSRAKHQDVKQYYTKLNHDLPRINKEIEEKQETVKELKNEIRVDSTWKAVTEIVDGFAKRKENKEKEEKLLALKKKLDQLTIALQKSQNETEKLKTDLLENKKEIRTMHLEVDKSIRTGMQEAVKGINTILARHSDKVSFQFDISFKNDKPIIEMLENKNNRNVPSVERIMGIKSQKNGLGL